MLQTDIENEYLSYCQPVDIVYRLMNYGFCKISKLNLIGQNGSFGTLEFFLYANNKEYRFYWNIFIKDKDKILSAIDFAINNFKEISSKEQFSNW